MTEYSPCIWDKRDQLSQMDFPPVETLIPPTYLLLLYFLLGFCIENRRLLVCIIRLGSCTPFSPLQKNQLKLVNSKSFSRKKFSGKPDEEH